MFSGPMAAVPIVFVGMSLVGRHKLLRAAWNLRREHPTWSPEITALPSEQLLALGATAAPLARGKEPAGAERRRLEALYRAVSCPRTGLFKAVGLVATYGGAVLVAGLALVLFAGFAARANRRAESAAAAAKRRAETTPTYVEASPPGCTGWSACLDRCDQGTAAACRQLGRWAEHGGGVEVDPKKALELYDRACVGGDALGCVMQGNLLAQGKGEVPRNPDLAARLFKKSCDARNVYGCTQLGRAALQGEGRPRSPQEALDLLVPVCRSGVAMGCVAAGESSIADGDDTEAARFFQLACDGGSLTGCTALGVLLSNGWGVAADVTRAQGILELGCTQGDGRACASLAALHDGKRLGRDPELSAKLTKQACELGDTESCAP